MSVHMQGVLAAMPCFRESPAPPAPHAANVSNQGPGSVRDAALSASKSPPLIGRRCGGLSPSLSPTRKLPDKRGQGRRRLAASLLLRLDALALTLGKQLPESSQPGTCAPPVARPSSLAPDSAGGAAQPVHQSRPPLNARSAASSSRQVRDFAGFADTK